MLFKATKVHKNFYTQKKMQQIWVKRAKGSRVYIFFLSANAERCFSLLNFASSFLKL